MATKIKAKKKAPDILDVQAQKGDIAKLTEQVKESPVLYATVAGFILVCIVAGIVYRVGSESSTRSGMTRFAQAIETDDPALRATELEPLAAGKGHLAAEALYMIGEAAFEAKQFDKAKESFERLRSEFPDSSLVPNAVEGLGGIAENAGQYDQAIAHYKEIVEKWPNSFARRRQQLNIGRCEEAAKDLKEAVKAYQAQVDEFPESSFEKDAKLALDRLRMTNPDLFPKEETAPASQTPSAEGPAATETLEVPTPALPAAPAPETPESQEQAPAPKAADETPAAPSETAPPSQ